MQIPVNAKDRNSFLNDIIIDTTEQKLIMLEPVTNEIRIIT